MKMRQTLCVCLAYSLACAHAGAAPEKTLQLSEVTAEAVSLQANLGRSGAFTWWLPPGADAYVLPISAGMVVDTSRADLMRWLRNQSPWSLLELPVLGLRYGQEMVVVIVPSPHYAELVVTDRLGIHFATPPGHRRRAPCDIVVQRCGRAPLEVARVFRAWRRSAAHTGVVPRPRPLTEKIADLEKVSRLPGAPHIYLWGPALFSRHDIPRNRWIPFAQALNQARPDSLGGRLTGGFTADQRRALTELAQADWPMKHLTLGVADALNRAMTRIDILEHSATVPAAEVIQRNQQALAQAFGEFVNSPASWGDGLSRTLLESLHSAGIDRALLLLSDLYGSSLRPDVAARAETLGYLLGPYDSYHSVHAPDALAEDTWETAQFDAAAYEQGRVINANGSGHAGFLGRGYHFAPQAAWPYMQRRIGRIVEQTPYSAWFIDCDATAECFDDFHPAHPATRIEDTALRRQRLRWLETTQRMVVGSEGGSILFADVFHFGHGVHTPYLGHLDPVMRDRQSPYFLGRHWPPDTPEQSFMPVPAAPRIRTPFLDPTVRVPLYQAVLGDEVITTHHWSFDSLKFEDLQTTRELMEILYMVPPMYHLNREAWPQRRALILRHLAFWGPLHRELACAPLTDWEVLSEDRLVQRTTFQTEEGEVSITVNFAERPQKGYPPHSAAATGPWDVPTRRYRIEP